MIKTVSMNKLKSHIFLKIENDMALFLLSARNNITYLGLYFFV